MKSFSPRARALGRIVGILALLGDAGCSAAPPQPAERAIDAQAQEPDLVSWFRAESKRVVVTTEEGMRDRPWFVSRLGNRTDTIKTEVYQPNDSIWIVSSAPTERYMGEEVWWEGWKVAFVFANDNGRPGGLLGTGVQYSTDTGLSGMWLSHLTGKVSSTMATGGADLWIAYKLTGTVYGITLTVSGVTSAQVDSPIRGYPSWMK
jgi:hypothetical protein